MDSCIRALTYPLKRNMHTPRKQERNIGGGSGSRGCDLACWALDDPLPVVPAIGVAPASEVASGLLASSEACLKELLGMC